MRQYEVQCRNIRFAGEEHPVISAACGSDIDLTDVFRRHEFDRAMMVRWAIDPRSEGGD